MAKPGAFILKKGNNVLNQRCLQAITEFPVSDEVLDTIDLCRDSLRSVQGFWRGKSMSIASTQVGKPQVALFVMCSRDNWHTPKQYKTFQTFINPRITAFSDNQCLSWEGCVSNDEEMVLIERPTQVRGKFHDIEGQEYEMLLSGLMSRIFQHEVDHLNGLVMWDDQVTENVRSSQPEGVFIPPRRIEKTQSLSELATIDDQDKFYRANRRYIFEH